LGGNLVLNYALRRRPRLAGVIATSPLLRLAFQPPAVKVTLGRIMNSLWPAFSQASGLETKALSRDPEVVRVYENDPLVHDHVSARMFMSFYQAGLWALEHAAEFPLPLLIMHGSADRLTSAEASREFADHVPGDCTFKLWDGLYHETHNEPQKQEVFNFLLTWLKAHTPT
jgi:alpha-beta hydrolase superfamily lysophospholipase